MNVNNQVYEHFNFIIGNIVGFLRIILIYNIKIIVKYLRYK